MGKSNAGGFTLIEMMVVIAVMGLLLLLVVSHGPEHSPVLALRSAVSELAQNLRLAHSKAIADNRAVPFVIKSATRSFGTSDDLEELPPGIYISLIATNARDIIFEPDGSAAAGVIRLTTGKLSQSVAVNWLTGQVSVSQVAINDQN